jgi:TldD protein
MSRCPIENFPKSNGHGRAEAGYEPVARQSNLILETTQPKSYEELRKLLIQECKAQGLPYGYHIIDITGGFTITGRTIPNSFNVMPTLVYRIYTDGRPDEIVRGVDLVGTPLAMFSQIAEAGNDFEIFTGICGAESGGVPVTAISPSLFVKKIETQKKSKSQEKPPLLPRPGTKPDKD